MSSIARSPKCSARVCFPVWPWLRWRLRGLSTLALALHAGDGVRFRDGHLALRGFAIEAEARLDVELGGVTNADEQVRGVVVFADLALQEQRLCVASARSEQHLAEQHDRERVAAAD